MAAILNCVILDSAILVFPLKLTLAKIGSHHLKKKNFTHTSLPTICTKNFTHLFWLKLMNAAILNSVMLDSATAILDSDTLLSYLRFTQNTLTPLWLWLKCRQLVIFSWIHSKTLSLHTDPDSN